MTKMDAARMRPYVKAEYDDQWPIHVAYDELREEQVEGYLHALRPNRKQRRTMLAVARRPEQTIPDNPRRHQRGTKAGNLLSAEQRQLEPMPTCEHGRTTYHGRNDKETKCPGP